MYMCVYICTYVSTFIFIFFFRFFSIIGQAPSLLGLLAKIKYRSVTTRYRVEFPMLYSRLVSSLNHSFDVAPLSKSQPQFSIPLYGQSSQNNCLFSYFFPISFSNPSNLASTCPLHQSDVQDTTDHVSESRDSLLTSSPGPLGATSAMLPALSFMPPLHYLHSLLFTQMPTRHVLFDVSQVP